MKDGSLYQRVGKRSFDLVAVVATAPLWIPLSLLVAGFVRRTMGTPVLFRQVRVGKNERLFTIWKFRTMTDESHSAGGPLNDADRITPVGAKLRSLSLDELPQLWQVMLGQLSLVGPRPLPPEYLPLYDDAQRRRHLVKPGLTGAAQVAGRNALPWPDRFAADQAYVDDVSLRVDLGILTETFRMVLRSRGVMESGTSASPPFRGNQEPDLR